MLELPLGSNLSLLFCEWGNGAGWVHELLVGQIGSGRIKVTYSHCPLADSGQQTVIEPNQNINISLLLTRLLQLRVLLTNPKLSFLAYLAYEIRRWFSIK